MTNFDTWWSMYPRKVAKQKCRQLWERRGWELLGGDMIASLQIQLAADYFPAEQKYIPHPYTYLNQGRYEDVPEVSMSGGKAALAQADAEIQKMLEQEGLL